MTKSAKPVSIKAKPFCGCKKGCNRNCKCEQNKVPCVVSFMCTGEHGKCTRVADDNEFLVDDA
jgi:hypothetical protein